MALDTRVPGRIHPMVACDNVVASHWHGFPSFSILS